MNPGMVPGSSTVSNLPVSLQGLISPEQFNFTMGLTGLICGFMIWIIWSRGL